ncbi:MAG: PadR family transcriptional regulator [Acidobacteria bacterium]|nr:MAG: PadR family transcriptional regulator [Acidobacteriota bacterium]
MTANSSKVPESAGVGNFEEQVLLAVIRTGADGYGMRVRRELERVTGRSVTIGSVYATLDRLEAKGLVISARTTTGADSPSRRIFSVTPAGARALVETRAARDKLWAGVNLQPLLPDV